MNWKKWQTIAALIVALIVIGTSGWKFYEVKADKVVVEQLAGNFEIYKMEQYRRHLQERIWAIQARFPQTYQQHPEYRRLVNELQQIDRKLDVYYSRGK